MVVLSLMRLLLGAPSEAEVTELRVLWRLACPERALARDCQNLIYGNGAVRFSNSGIASDVYGRLIVNRCFPEAELPNK